MEPAARQAHSMFTILGGDGQEYGPASVEQIRAWIASGRANLETRAKKQGESDWRRLGDFAEFAPPTAGTPPVMGRLPPPKARSVAWANALARPLSTAA